MMRKLVTIIIFASEDYRDDVQVMYVENEGFYYSDENPELFDLLPSKQGKVTRNDNEPSYFMMVKEGRRKGTLDDAQARHHNI